MQWKRARHENHGRVLHKDILMPNNSFFAVRCNAARWVNATITPVYADLKSILTSGKHGFSNFLISRFTDHLKEHFAGP